jgi:hypothetical protein
MSSGPFLQFGRATPHRYTVAGANPKARPDAAHEGIFRSNLTPEDRATYFRWVLFVAAFYACASLLLLLAALTLAAPAPPSGSARVASPHRLGPPVSAIWSAAQQREWPSSPTDSSGEVRIGLDAQNR